MPVNNTPIKFDAEPTGGTQLPFTRVKRLINLDQEVNTCSSQGAFVITIATEMFIQYLAEQAHNVVKSERKPRRNIQYRDLANAVSRQDNLEFLSDVIPKTIPYSEVKQRKAPASANNTNSDTVEVGQTTLNGKHAAVLNGTATNEMVHVATNEDVDIDAGDPNAQLNHEMEIRGARTSTGSLGRNGRSRDDEEMKE